MNVTPGGELPSVLKKGAAPEPVESMWENTM